MVPIRRASERILVEDGRAAIIRELSRADRNSVDEAFANWLHNDLTGLKETIRLVLAEHGALNQYKTVSVLGFGAALASLSESQHELFVSRLRWLAGREPIVDGLPAPFCADSPALFGVALGCRSLDSPEISNEVRSCFLRFLHLSHERAESWQKVLLEAAARQLDAAVSNLTLDGTAAESLVALASRNILDLPTKQLEDAELHLLSAVRQEPARGMSHARLSLRLTALNWTLRSTPVAIPGRMTVEQIVNLLKRVPSGLRRWTWEQTSRTRGGNARTWQIDNEYHIQNLLYFLLAPILPDLTDEQYLAPVGQKNPRADLIVPSMKLIIEVKFQRAGDAPQKLIDEIASDASLYLVKGSAYGGIVCFIWDDAARIGDHDYLAAGLKKIHGILDVVIIPRPGNMSGA